MGELNRNKPLVIPGYSSIHPDRAYKNEQLVPTANANVDFHGGFRGVVEFYRFTIPTSEQLIPLSVGRIQNAAKRADYIYTRSQSVEELVKRYETELDTLDPEGVFQDSDQSRTNVRPGLPHMQNEERILFKLPENIRNCIIQSNDWLTASSRNPVRTYLSLRYGISVSNRLNNVPKDELFQCTELISETEMNGQWELLVTMDEKGLPAKEDVLKMAETKPLIIKHAAEHGCRQSSHLWISSYVQEPQVIEVRIDLPDLEEKLDLNALTLSSKYTGQGDMQLMSFKRVPPSFIDVIDAFYGPLSSVASVPERLDDVSLVKSRYAVSGLSRIVLEAIQKRFTNGTF